MGFWDYKGLADPSVTIPSGRDLLGYNGMFLLKDKPSTAQGAKASPPMQFKNPFDQATMSTSNVMQKSLAESVIPSPVSAAPVFDKKQVAKVGAATARKGGGWAMGTGGTVYDDSNVGLAVRDAQERQEALNAGGVGVGGGSLAQRLGSIRSGRGPGGLVNAIMQSKVAASDANKIKSDRSFGLAADELQLKTSENITGREKSLAEIDFKKGYLDVLKRQTETGSNARSFEQQMAKINAAHPGKDYDAEIQKAIIAANAADPQALSSAMTNYRNVREGKVFVPGQKKTGFGGFLGIGSPKTEDQWTDPNEVVKRRKGANGQMEGLTRDGRIIPLQ